MASARLSLIHNGMKLDMNELYHNYITKVVIFALFLYKGQLRQPNVYRQSVGAFVAKRLPWKIKLRVETYEEWIDKDITRDLLLDELLDGKETPDELWSVGVRFTTPLKETLMEINLRDEARYEKYLYS